MNFFVYSYMYMYLSKKINSGKFLKKNESINPQNLLITVHKEKRKEKREKTRAD